MKRILLSFIFIICATISFAYDVEVDGIYYNLVDGKAEVAIGSYSGSVNIPSKIIVSGVEYPVTSIGLYAFYDCHKLTSVTIPNSVTIIETEAFYGCCNLTSITIPNSVTSIGVRAFEGCHSLPIIDNIRYADTYLVEIIDKTLASYNIKEGTNSIGIAAFSNCNSLTSVSFPNSVTSIGKQAFSNCESLTSVTISNSVTNIETDAFEGCSNINKLTWGSNVNISRITQYCHKNLKNVTLLEGVTSIGEGAFKSCSELTSVAIPNSVTNIGEYAFQNCRGITSVTIPYSVTSIGENAFDKVNNIAYTGTATGFPWGAKSVNGFVEGNLVYKDESKEVLLGCSSAVKNHMTIPNSVVSIGEYAFYYCSNLTSIEIPNSVKTIKNNALAHCSGLSSLVIPNSVTSIGDHAFSKCSGISSLIISNSVTTIEDYTFANCSNLSTVVIPNSVTSIGNYAFYYCTSLSSVVIPNSVSNIGNSAFYKCSSLSSVTIPKYVWNIGEDAFYYCSSLNELTCLTKETPVIGSSVFKKTQCSTGTLYVPAESFESYKTANGWKDWSTIIGIETKSELKDGEDFTNNETKICDITYYRSFSNTSWQALYVPFAMSYDDWKNDFEVAYINDVHQYDSDEDGVIDRTDIEVIKLKEGKSIDPNTPYLIKAKTTGEKTITLEDAILYKTEENAYDVTSWFTRFNFIGTYHTVTDMATKGYYAMADGGLKKATSDAVTLKPFRWYLSVTDRNGNPIILNSKAMNIVFDDGEATGIETISNEAKENSSIHTLTGISKGNDVKALSPGIYIKNGKKFIIK